MTTPHDGLRGLAAWDDARTDRLLTIPEAAALVGVKPGTIRQWIHRGHLRPVRIHHGGRQHVLEHEVTRCHRERTPNTTRQRIRAAAQEWQQRT